MLVIKIILLILSVIFILLGLVIAFNLLLGRSYDIWGRYFLLVGLGIVLYGVSQFF